MVVTSKQTVEVELKLIDKLTRPLREIGKRFSNLGKDFDVAFLGIMFSGMALKRVFEGIARSATTSFTSSAIDFFLFFHSCSFNSYFCVKHIYNIHSSLSLQWNKGYHSSYSF